MATRKERIIVEAVSRLNAPGRPPGLHFHRNRTLPIERDTLPSGVAYPAVPPLGGESETVERLDHDDGVERRMNLRIELRVAGDVPDALIDPHYAWTVRALREDPTLGGLCLDIQELRHQDDAVVMNVPVGARAVDFAVTYITSEDDPEEGGYEP